MNKTLPGAALLVAVAALLLTQAKARTLTTLFSFDGKDGAFPVGNLLADSAGNLFGTASTGSNPLEGVVFELTPPRSGNKTWTQNVLVDFKDGTPGQGTNPEGSLIADSAGNLYGTLASGGNSEGAVFKLIPPSSGQTTWTETTLFSFTGTDGADPTGSLLADKAGNLYGTTSRGGFELCPGHHRRQGCGTVFELTPPGPGQTAWTETVLLAFKKTGGVGPAGSLIADAAGNLYGTTLVGGESDLGTVFELSPPAPHKTAWTETVLLAFDGSSGENPASSLVPDSAGNLYGTTARGGAFGAGTVFELSPPVSGQSAWTETVLWSFDKSDGLQPMGNLIFDSSGSLYGTTSRGGAYQKCNRKLDCGTVFKLTPPGVGQTTWTESVLVSFNVKDGALPFGGLIADQRGHFYGTTAGVSTGKRINLGTVFKLTP